MTKQPRPFADAHRHSTSDSDSRANHHLHNILCRPLKVNNRPMSSEAQPQVNEQALWTPNNSVAQRAFGYTFDYIDKLAWANKHNIAPEKPPYIRCQLVQNKVASRLPKGHRRLAVVVDHKSPVLCIVIGSNTSEQEIAKTKDESLLQKFSTVLGEERRPRWYDID